MILIIVNADELKELSEPLINYLKENCSPNCVVVVRNGRVEVLDRLINADLDCLEIE